MRKFIHTLLVFIIFIFAVSSYSKLTQFEATGEKRDSFSFEEVCKFYGINHLPLIEAPDMHRLDCMGKTIEVTEFCSEKFKTKNLLRGYTVSETKMVVCHRADVVKLSVTCDERDKEYCLSSKDGCMKLKTIFAKELELVHQSLIPSDDSEKQLNCYYSNDGDENLARL